MTLEESIGEMPESCKAEMILDLLNMLSAISLGRRPTPPKGTPEIIFVAYTQAKTKQLEAEILAGGAIEKAMKH